MKVFSDLFYENKKIKDFDQNYNNMSNNQNLKYISESSLSRVFLKYKECQSGTISAFRGERTYNENKELSKNLKRELLALGYSVTRIIGKYVQDYQGMNQKEVKEESYIVFDCTNRGQLKDDLKKLAKKYEQDCIAFAEPGEDYYFYGVCGWPGPGKKLKAGKPVFGSKEFLPFASAIKNRQFIFKVDESIHNIDDKNSRYGYFGFIGFEKIKEKLLKEFETLII